jgi:hypothetical protein
VRQPEEQGRVERRKIVSAAFMIKVVLALKGGPSGVNDESG